MQHAALMAGTDTVLNGESKHPQSLEGKQCTTTEWNDNIKRTAIWRSRNESLLKAMRGAADIDSNDFGASNAHDTYTSLRSKYCASENQRAFELFTQNLVVGFELNDSPQEIAIQLQTAFNQYNQLVGNNVEQRLPENFLKMAFLGSLNSAYGDWRKALLRERDVLALGQGSTMTFNELVNLVVVEQTQLLQQPQKDTTGPTLAPPSQQAPKRNISHVDEPSQPDSHRPCSLPHDSSGKHTNHACKTQDPRLRQENWRPTKADQIYLAEHPEIEDSQFRDISLENCDDGSGNDPEDGSESGSVDYPDEEPEHDFQNGSDDNTESASGSDAESGSENENESEQETSDGGRDGASISDQDDVRKENDDYIEPAPTVDKAWQRFVAARFVEVQAQIKLVTPALDKCKKHGKSARKHAPSTGDLSGKWLLYNERYVSGTSDHYHIRLWRTTGKLHSTTHPGSQQYAGELTVGSHGHSTTFKMCGLSPSPRVTGHAISLRFRQPGTQAYSGKVTFWGDGKMFVTLPSSVLGAAAGRAPRYKFAGLQSSLVGDSSGTGAQADTRKSENRDHETSVVTGTQVGKRPEHDGHAETAGEYDRVIRTKPSAGVVVKVENECSDVIIDDDDHEKTAAVIKTEEPESSDSDDGRADDVASIIDMVQKQKDSLRAGLTAPLQYLPGVWSFHSPDYKQERGRDIEIFFYDRIEHDSAERTCAPGHCKSTTGELRYCGELRFKAKKGERDWSCRLRQFDVPKQASVDPVRIQSWDTRSKRVIAITAWFLGGGAMSMSIQTTYVPNYQGQKDMITFSGIKRG